MAQELERIPDYYPIDSATKEQLLSSEPYAYLWSIDDPFDRQMELEQLRARGKAIGVSNVLSLWTAFERSMKKSVPVENEKATNFLNQKLDLKTTFEANDGGIYKEGEVACYHPIMPIKRYQNVDTGMEKIELAYKPNRKWKTAVIEKSILASPTKILQLADLGISVTSETAKKLIEYLQEIEALNYDKIPTVQSVSRLGWVGNDFVPYSTDFKFDGDVAFKTFFESIKAHGDKDVWLKTMQEIRQTHPVCRIVTAASLLSPMLEWIDSLPTFVHIWSSKSATGKTLLLMAGASIWGNPNPGVYIQSFNSTAVANERIAGTANSLPVFLDELQLAKDNWGRTNFDVYKLSQGYGKGRGTKIGGLDRMETWRNVFITSGESPIVNDTAGQGAFARVVEIELDEIIFSIYKGNKISNLLRNNYGWGGQVMVEGMKQIGVDLIKEQYNLNLKKIQETNNDYQDKQIMVAAGLLTADHYARDYVFGDETELTIDDLKPFLVTKKSSSIGERALEITRDWIASNDRRFGEGSNLPDLGFRDNNYTYIIRSEFNKLMEENGFSNRSVLTEWDRDGLILSEVRKSDNKKMFATRKSINGQIVYMVALKHSS